MAENITFEPATDAFPNCPSLSRRLGLQQASQPPAELIGWGPWRRRWCSVCSKARGRHNPDCLACRTGRYRNVWLVVAGHFIYTHWPRLWRWWANRGR